MTIEDTKKFGDGEFQPLEIQDDQQNYNEVGMTMEITMKNLSLPTKIGHLQFLFPLVYPPPLPRTLTISSSFMELGLKLTEVQCKKISFAGKKLRLLGKINCTVHCSGQFLGNFHLRRVSQRDLSIHHQTTAAQSHRVSRLILMRSQASRTPGYSTSRCSPTTSGTRT